MKNYFLPEENRARMQKAWGKPLFGSEKEISEKYSRLLEKKKYKTVITVGDYCSHHLNSDIKIFDKKVQRQDFAQKHGCAAAIKNPAGTIQKESWEAIKQAIKEKSNICVEGEEDLLAIPALLLAKPKTLVIYGFPNKGICLIEANLKNKTIFRLALKKFFKTTKT
jgi:hypothetical protein